MVDHSLALVLITIFSMIVLIGVSPWVKRVLNCYPIWAIIGALLLTYLIVQRFFDAWNTHSSAPGKEALTDWCAFGSLFTCVLMIVDPTRRALRTIAPINIFASLVTIFALFVTDVGQTDVSLWQIIWKGEPPNEIYFSMHYIMLMGSLAAILSGPCLKLRHGVYALGVFILYVIYVQICIKTLQITYNANGFVQGDWIAGGEYSTLFDMISSAFFHNQLADSDWWKALIIGGVFAVMIIIVLYVLFSLLMHIRFWKWYRVVDRKKILRPWWFGFWQLNFDSKDNHWWFGWYGKWNNDKNISEYKLWDDKLIIKIKSLFHHKSTKN